MEVYIFNSLQCNFLPKKALMMKIEFEKEKPRRKKQILMGS